jgi:cytochrome c-type biogenesis protein CcmH
VNVGSLALLAALVSVATLAPPARGQEPAIHVDQREVYEIATRLRCVVCQNLSVADSPSEMASQMRAIVRERLAAGERPEQVIQYFVDRYGDWILLEPRRRGFTLLVWVAPVVAVGAGLLVVGVLVTRWSRPPAPEAAPGVPDPVMRERIRREMERET